MFGFRAGGAGMRVAGAGIAASLNGTTITPASVTGVGMSTPVALTDGANIALDASLSNVYTVTLGGARTLSNPTNLVAGQTFMLIITQDGTGGRALTFSSYFGFGAEGAPDLTTSTASKVDIVSCYVRSTTKIDCTTLRGYV